MGPANRGVKIGITGGIGSGKSLVTRIFGLLGVPAYNADERARWLMNHDRKLVYQIKKRFGERSFNEYGLDRAYMARTVFNDEEQLKALNELVHPRVGEDYLEWLRDKSAYPYTIKEAALLFEAGTYKDLDKVVLVYAPQDTRLKRVLERDPWRTEEGVRRIMANQMPEEEKKEKADEVIRNDESRLLIEQVLELDHKWKG